MLTVQSSAQDKPTGTHVDRPTRGEPALGAVVCASDSSCEFTVWAPHSKLVQVSIRNEQRTIDLVPQERGYHRAVVSDVQPGARYVFKLANGVERADPASRYQPEGVFGPSEIVDLADFRWHDQAWRGLQLKDYVLYELHVGTYTAAGTLDALIEHVNRLKSLGVTAIELMPLAQFPGTRNWGYDGVFPYAVQNSYGGPRGLQRFVDACHQEGLAVVLDVVYNHLGPEGNFLSNFGPYFTDRYHTPWGAAINFDDAHSDEVVRFFVENAQYWLEHFHVDALRLDAIHGIFDRSAQPFLASLSSAVDQLASKANRHIYLIAESDLNDARFLQPRSSGGYGLHAQWNDDFHHSVHCLQTGERASYYQDFGSLGDLQKAMQNGYVYTGQYSRFRQRRHGNSSAAIQPSQLVVYSQNHDQVGNRMLGERSSALISFEALKLSAGVVILSANLPLLFMGEEYGETAPFLYFTSHSDPKLGEAVREGRRAEYSGFYHGADPPDPQAESTFLRSKPDHRLRNGGSHLVLWNFYQELLRLRKSMPAVNELDEATREVTANETNGCLRMLRSYAQNEIMVIFNFSDNCIDCSSDIPRGAWQKHLNSADVEWNGPGSAVPEIFPTDGNSHLIIAPKSLCVFERSSRSSRVSC